MVVQGVVIWLSVWKDDLTMAKAGGNKEEVVMQSERSYSKTTGVLTTERSVSRPAKPNSEITLRTETEGTSPCNRPFSLIHNFPRTL